MTAPLDEATRARLRWEAERLAAEQELALIEARRIVWLDYLDEQKARPPMRGAEPAVVMPAEEAPPGPEPPPAPTPGRRGFWDARNEKRLTPEWLARNKAELARVKRLVGLRS